jgi:hypothetical protein
MDILNWIYLVKNKLTRTQVESQDDLVILGSNVGYEKKGDKYQSYGMKVSDFAQVIANDINPGGDNIGYYILDFSAGDVVNITTNKGIIKVVNADLTFTSALGPFAIGLLFKLNHPDITTGDECYVQFTSAYQPSLIKDSAMPHIRGKNIVPGIYNAEIYDMAALNVGNTAQFQGQFLIYYELQTIS